MKLLALERIDIFGTNHLFIGNYIFDFKSNLLKKTKNKKIKISWAKKTKEYNINSEFICLPTPIRILNKTLGYLLNFTKVSYYSFADNREIVDKTYIPLQDINQYLTFNYEKQSYILNSTKKETSEIIKRKVNQIINGYKKSLSHTDDTEEEESEEETEN